MNYVLALVPLLSFAAPLQAQAPAPQSSESLVVQTADLDLSRAADRHLLDRRLDRAVIGVCGEAMDFDLAGQAIVARCRFDTRSAVNARRDTMLAHSLFGADAKVANRR